MTVEERTLSMLVNNRPGVLSRIAAVFSSRGYNISTLCVAETINPDISRITLTSSADSDFTEKIKKQLYKLVDVLEVSDFSGPAFLHRELMIFGVKVTPETRIEIMRAIERFGCRIATMSQSYYILESTGSRPENEAVLAYFDPFGVEEMNRTGSVALKKIFEAATPRTQSAILFIPCRRRTLSHVSPVSTIEQPLSREGANRDRGGQDS